MAFFNAFKKEIICFDLSSSDDTLDQPKYKCIVGLNFVEQISNQVDFEIHKYLFDFA